MSRRYLIPLSVAVMLPHAAHAAADKPVIVPAPSWVVAHTARDDAAAGDAPVRLLLDDQQVRFEGGKTINFQEIAFRIQTPQGLGAGAINFTWNPDTEVLNVHKLVIRRGDQTIDVLAGGQQFTVLRREQNLEVAMLNGELTANIQPEGLQVGDIIDYAASIVHQDPVLKGHYEAVAGNVGPLPIALLSLGASWPAATDLRWHAHGDLPTLRKVQHGAVADVALQLTNAQPISAPKEAPARFTPGRYVAFSDYPSWAELSALFAPLYVKAARLAPGSPLHAEAAKIAAASPDPKLRAAAALKLVQDRVRYVFIGMGEAGLVPAAADETWSRRFGDCKGKTALLLALLGELGIPAQPALANIGGNDGLDAELPLVSRFNHVLVRATIAGRVYWLDGTQTGDGEIDAIEPPGFNWVLPVQAAHGALERIVQVPLDQPQLERWMTLDATGGLSLPAPAHAEEVIRGRAGVMVHNQMGAVAGNILDDGMRNSWRKQYPSVEIKSVSQSYDPVKREQRLVMDGSAQMEWREGRYETDQTGVGYEADFARAPGPDHDAPYAVAFPNFVRITETIRLPDRGWGFAITSGAAVDQTLGGVHWQRSAGIADGVATIKASMRSIAPEFSATEAPAVQLRLREMAHSPVYIARSGGYGMALPASPLTNLGPPIVPPRPVFRPAPALTISDAGRGESLLNAGHFPDAVTAFNRALTGNAHLAWILSERGIALDAIGLRALAAQDAAAARVEVSSQPSPAPRLNAMCWRKATLGRALAEALADCDAGLKLLPTAFQIMDSRGFVLLRLGRFQEAIAQYDQALALNAKLASSLYGRALAKLRLGQAAAHDQDVTMARLIDPGIGEVFAGFGVKPDGSSSPATLPTRPIVSVVVMPAPSPVNMVLPPPPPAKPPAAPAP